MGRQNQKPNKDWLQFVAPTRARQHIRKALREEEMKEAEGDGDASAEAKNWKVPQSTTRWTDYQVFHFKTHSDLFFAIATSMLDPLKVKEALMPQLRRIRKHPPCL